MKGQNYIEKIKQGVYNFDSIEWRGISQGTKDYIRKLLQLHTKQRLRLQDVVVVGSIQKQYESVSDYSLIKKVFNNLIAFHIKRNQYYRESPEILDFQQRLSNQQIYIQRGQKLLYYSNNFANQITTTSVSFYYHTKLTFFQVNFLISMGSLGSEFFQQKKGSFEIIKFEQQIELFNLQLTLKLMLKNLSIKQMILKIKKLRRMKFFKLILRQKRTKINPTKFRVPKNKIFLDNQQIVNKNRDEVF
ncbi:unnamed protein product [Paramecium sonneborni]|uniref:Uncharacterized protein n=1 Tax=Paramecium sonneborni TaxID=65129 RepID=A0A8S1PNQ4_9CILI|nr:unnamed protein product [Paramecium sonneborni]